MCRPEAATAFPQSYAASKPGDKSQLQRRSDSASALFVSRLLPIRLRCVLLRHNMTHNEHEQAQRRLEEARRAGVELVETAYRAQMAALDVVWKLVGGAPGDSSLPSEEPVTTAPVAPEPPPPPPPPPPAQRKRRPGGEVKEELRRIYTQLPETFGRADIHALLGYEPERAGLYRSLAEMSSKGALVIVKPALGRTPAVYRKIAAELPPDD